MKRTAKKSARRGAAARKSASARKRGAAKKKAAKKKAAPKKKSAPKKSAARKPAVKKTIVTGPVQAAAAVAAADEFEPVFDSPGELPLPPEGDLPAIDAGDDDEL